MTPELALYIIMVERGMVINDGTMQSLRDAISNRDIYFFDDKGVPSGFVTWFLDGDVLEINNLCIFSNNAITKLFILREFLHKRYPNLSKVRWYSDKHQREVEYEFLKDEQYHRSVSTAENCRR